MMPYASIREMLFIHFLIGVGVVILFTLRAGKHGHTRGIFDFGEGILGQQGRWIQWYSWSMMFEVITSFLYMHSGMLYFELAFSVFEAASLTIGAFIADRLVDAFMGSGEVVSIPKMSMPDIHMPDIKGKVNTVFDNVGKAVREGNEKAVNAESLKRDSIKQENATFDDLTKGH